MCCTMCAEKSVSESLSTGGERAKTMVARAAAKSAVRQRRSSRSRRPTAPPLPPSAYRTATTATPRMGGSRSILARAQKR